MWTRGRFEHHDDLAGKLKSFYGSRLTSYSEVLDRFGPSFPFPAFSLPEGSGFRGLGPKASEREVYYETDVRLTVCMCRYKS